MIFVTVGTQLPFDRLVHAVDRWAAASGRDDVFVQAGPTEDPPRHVAWTAFLEPAEFERRCAEAQLLVAHAGMGTILGALVRGKPVLVMPRRADLREQRNDHQAATVRRLVERGLVHAAADERELEAMLGRVDELVARPPIGAHASPDLIDRLRRFIGGEAA